MKNGNTQFGMMMALATVGFGLLFANPSFAQTSEKIKIKYVDNSSGARLKIKEKLTVDFNGWTHVEKLKVKVKGEIPGFTVFSNGIAHTPTYFPRSERNPEAYYECPINEAANAVQLMGDAESILGGVSYDYVDRALRVPEIRGFGGSMPTEEVRKIISAVENLSQYMTLTEQQTYMLPIKVAAGHALALEYGRGEYSMRAGAAIQALIAQVDFANTFLEQEMSIAATYDWAVYLVSVRERLAQITE